MPFQKGKSGNPNGRPKGAVGLAEYIRKQTHEGRDLADLMIRIALAQGEFVKVSTRNRMEAITWLADRGLGKPVQPIAGDNETLVALEMARRILFEEQRGNGLDTPALH